MKIFLIIFILLTSTKSYAYFDPGTGSFIVQSLIAFFTVIIIYLKLPFLYIKNFFSKFKKKNKNK